MRRDKRRGILFQRLHINTALPLLSRPRPPADDVQNSEHGERKCVAAAGAGAGGGRDCVTFWPLTLGRALPTATSSSRHPPRDSPGCSGGLSVSDSVLCPSRSSRVFPPPFRDPPSAAARFLVFSISRRLIRSRFASADVSSSTSIIHCSSGTAHRPPIRSQVRLPSVPRHVPPRPWPRWPRPSRRPPAC